MCSPLDRVGVRKLFLPAQDRRAPTECHVTSRDALWLACHVVLVTYALVFNVNYSCAQLKNRECVISMYRLPGISDSSMIVTTPITYFLIFRQIVQPVSSKYFVRFTKSCLVIFVKGGSAPLPTEDPRSQRFPGHSMMTLVTMATNCIVYYPSTPPRDTRWSKVSSSHLNPVSLASTLSYTGCKPGWCLPC